jgi:hypothetical protein
MFIRVRRWVKSLGAARAGVLLFASGLLGLGGDVAVSHFAGRDMKSPVQLVPVIAAPIAFALLTALGLKRWPQAWFRKGVRAVGAALCAVGLTGTGFHVAAFLRLLEGQSVTLKNIELALAVAPPIAAPGAFIALGGLLWIIASPRLSLELVPRGARSGLIEAASRA